MSEQVRRRREALGLSQMDVAAAAGLSRQLIGTVESARHVPSVNAALAIARALETTVEHLFGNQIEQWEAALEEPADEGTALLAVRVGERLVYAPLSEHGAGSFWQRADGTFKGGRVQLFTGIEPEGFAVAGCDPALGLAASFLPQRGPSRLVAIPATSATARRALDDGRLHAALIHGPAESIGAPSGGVARMKLARWRVGLAGRPGSRIDLARVASGRTRLARLAAGAEAQKALDRALRGHGGSSKVTGPIASGHLESARFVAYGAADLGVVMEPAARAYGLQFNPLEDHLVVLEIHERWAENPGARALTALFASRTFRAHLGVVGGYDLPPS
jgi:DNA-binding XRE family transcriptional regulator